MKYQWLLFDADNTLFDFSAASHLAFNDLISSLGLMPSDDLYKEYNVHNKGVWTAFEKGEINSTDLRSKRFRLFFEAVGISFDPMEANNIYLANLVKHAMLIDGAKALLKALVDRGYKLAIITNGLKEVQRPRIAAAEMTSYFQHIIVSDEIGVAKPHFDYFDHVHKLIGEPEKKSVLVIGDNPSSDIIGGINFGYDTCFYNYHKKDDSFKHRAKYSISALKELLTIV